MDGLGAFESLVVPATAAMGWEVAFELNSTVQVRYCRSMAFVQGGQEQLRSSRSRPGVVAAAVEHESVAFVADLAGIAVVVAAVEFAAAAAAVAVEPAQRELAPVS